MASQHTAEFRQEAVRIALTSGLNRKQVASDGTEQPRNRCSIVKFARSWLN